MQPSRINIWKPCEGVQRDEHWVKKKMMSLLISKTKNGGKAQKCRIERLEKERRSLGTGIKKAEVFDLMDTEDKKEHKNKRAVHTFMHLCFFEGEEGEAGGGGVAAAVVGGEKGSVGTARLEGARGEHRRRAGSIDHQRP